MIRAVKKENNKVTLLLSQKVEPFIIKSASYLYREIRLLKTLQLFVKSAFVLTLDRRPGKFCLL
ncbi:hypothetical protein LEP1GSC132_0594 [Leptospira kirschneri str. 200803703]|uniref:Uncharacterized protein n=1 Tax=Leptospira kirschneri serovar Pomona TaxID=561005 RepID=A0A1T1DMZ1_9LEPT|nr:hypothetical protein LEP1GSC042_2361 [Leptospira kirschneri serovar Bim str. PUO 1247]EMO68982.1 hypothetical protein LEP1GSC132_0594 [Leptospira kirschneri str. 200803703]KON78018.1 Uncharacterized protein NV38_0001297 [Leptospira kirschneri serovar Mozdok]OOV42090.1 hypothetical protein B1J93_10825 [Leptospira kirschneri serovar Pomona]OOV47851.1 hypothetical protein B1J94_14260 [Leptospira kirschneri serovar Grippotyphosa]